MSLDYSQCDDKAMMRRWYCDDKAMVRRFSVISVLSSESVISIWI
jgi:hypothetical protein